MQERFLSIVYGRAVRKLRGDRSLSEVAAAARCGEGAYRDIEEGQRDLPRWDELRSMAVALRCAEEDIGREMARILRLEFPPPADEGVLGGRSRQELVAVLGIPEPRFDRVLASYSAVSGFTGCSERGRYPAETVIGFLLYYFKVWEPDERQSLKKAREREPAAEDIQGALSYTKRQLQTTLKVVERTARTLSARRRAGKGPGAVGDAPAEGRGEAGEGKRFSR